MPRATAENTESELFQLATSPSHLLHRAEQLAATRFAELAKDALTLRQFALLAAVGAEPGLSQSALVRRTGIDRSTVAEIMSRMERRGLVTRTASALDARALSVHLSQSGGAMLMGMSRHARAADAAILDLLPRTKRRAFLNTLTKLAKLADEQAERAEREAKRQAKREAREKRRKSSRRRPNKASRKERS
jgi:MarR family transcriptional regulator, temperature-dependent positive regulator of motility